MCPWCVRGCHGPLASSRDEVRGKSTCWISTQGHRYPRRCSGRLLPHLSPGPSSSFSRGPGHPEGLCLFPVDQDRHGFQNACSGGLSVHRLNLLNSPHFFLGHLPSLTPSLHPGITRQWMLTACRKENKTGLMQ